MKNHFPHPYKKTKQQRHGKELIFLNLFYFKGYDTARIFSFKFILDYCYLQIEAKYIGINMNPCTFIPFM